MNTVTISSKYQVVIPREIRNQFNLKLGQITCTPSGSNRWRSIGILGA